MARITVPSTWLSGALMAAMSIAMPAPAMLANGAQAPPSAPAKPAEAATQAKPDDQKDKPVKADSEKSDQEHAKQLRASRNRFRHLTARAIASRRAISDLEDRLARYGWTINSNLAAARVRMEEFMDDADQDLRDGDIDQAEESMNYAEAAIERVEKLLGAR